jgi:hypothetical protein
LFSENSKLATKLIIDGLMNLGTGHGEGPENK